MATEEPEIVRFAKLVRLMRAAQLRYFRGDHSPKSVNSALYLEQRVDKAAAWILERRAGVELFPGSEVGDGPFRPRKGGRS